MRRFGFAVLVFLIFGIITAAAFKNKINRDLTQPVHLPTSIPTPTNISINNQGQTHLSLFVPYWTLPDEQIDAEGIDDLIYFGIKPDARGISGDDQGELEKFIETKPAGISGRIGVRMTDTQSNLSVLGDEALEKKIIDQTIEIAQRNGMEGVVLDLEISAIPFDSLTKQINKLSNMFYAACKKNNLSYTITLYGDTFYRPRPFDVKTLTSQADEIMIMAYDLHKAGGNPGPNFPLGGRDKYGYDLAEMAGDFLRYVPAEKMTVVFGLFGYDWEVDDKGKAIQQAKALTLAQIKSKFIKYKQTRDEESGETQVVYEDSDGEKHIVWFEDMESVKQKEDFLKKKGINSFGYWAYSYY